MSHSTASAEPSQTLEEYRAAWKALNRLVRQGKSLSGRERNCAFLNYGGARFANVSAITGLDYADDGRGLAVVDWDHDGDLDLWLRNRTGPRLRLMLNGSIGAENPFASVSFLLRGTRANRDAIGARVEVELAQSAAGRLVQTLTAGDGFLSQSSKWLHFGLGGAAPRIAAVRVRWPGGREELFRGVAPGRRYLLVEGSGAAEDVTRPRTVRLQPSEQPRPPPDARARLFLSARVPLPRLPYLNLHEEQRSVRSRGGPLLVTLWASWCGSCLEELREWTERERELREAGIDIIALSVDELQDDAATDAADAARVLDQLGFPFASGRATTELLDKLERLEDFLFSRPPPFAVPTTLLIDGRGRLMALYRGAVDMATLLADVSLADVSPEDLRALAVPLGGSWNSPPRPSDPHLRRLADQFQQHYPEDSLAFLSGALDELEAWQLPPDSPDWMRKRLTADRVRTLLRLARQLEGQGQIEEALGRYDQVVRLDPRQPEAHIRLGTLLADRGRHDLAVGHYRAVLAADPRNLDAYNNLGVTLVALGDYANAVGAYQRALQIDPASAEANGNLAAVYFGFGRIPEAIRHYERALESDPDSGASRYGLGVALYSSGQASQALAQFREALRIDPDALGPLNEAAWILATDPDPTLRDPDEAIRLAEHGAELSARQDGTALDTLAAAYASAGRFDRAVTTASEALAVSQRAQEQELAVQLRQRLALYRQNRPYVEQGLPE